ncbi:MAG: ABC transporter permease [Bdellovibrionales bacterium]|nr:ABC transporter permease [Bdellovibrionales bacterium]
MNASTQFFWRLYWIWKLALRSLLRQPRRTATVLLTVGIGTASLFLFQGFNTSIMNSYRENSIHARYGHGQLHTAGYRDSVYEKPWEHWIEDSGQIRSELLKMPEVKQVFPRIEFFALLTNGQINVSGRGTGVDGKEESTFFTTMNVVEGKMLSDEPEGILIGRGLANALNLKPGDRVTVLANTIHGSLNGADLTVTGIFHTGSKEFDDVAFRIPLSQAQKLLDTEKVESIALGLARDEDWDIFSQKVATVFPQLSATSFAVLDKIYYQHSIDWLKSQFGVIRLIILAVVVLGIFNVVATSIFERKAEIGNLRANGDSRWDVLLLLLSEGTAVGLIGALVGILGAAILNSTLLSKGILMPPAPGLTRTFHIPIVLDLWTAVITFALGGVSCLFATLLSAWRVVGMSIGNALRST